MGKNDAYLCLQNAGKLLLLLFSYIPTGKGRLKASSLL